LDDLEMMEAAESAVTPKRRLPDNEPKELETHPVAAREWRRLMRLYNSLEADIVSRLDMGMLLDYCISVEQLGELDELRQAVMREWKNTQAIVDDLESICEEEPDGCDRKELIKAIERAGYAFERVVKVDGRVDRKRALILSFRQSLYLTPRSRAGVTPQDKQKEEAKSELDALLDG
jgi:phage terminase small subunit